MKVWLFEAENRLGGHTSTVDVPLSDDKSVPVDTGFIVMNDCNYGVLHQLFCHWGVEVRWSDMSFSYYDPKRPFYYAGTDIFGMFAQSNNILDPSFYSFLFGVIQFCRKGLSFLKDGGASDDTLDDFLKKNNVDQNVVTSYVLPMASAIWSAPYSEVKKFPASTFFRFFKNHGLLALSERPRWQTVCGGSSFYINKFKENFSGELLIDDPVVSVKKGSSSLHLQTRSSGQLDFDEVVFSCHADQALTILAKPSDLQEKLLSPWSYQANQVVLHTDPFYMPPKRVAWGSWNYWSPSEEKPASSPVLTYYMNLLQGIEGNTDYFVTLNPSSDHGKGKYGGIDEARVIKVFKL